MSPSVKSCLFTAAALLGSVSAAAAPEEAVHRQLEVSFSTGTRQSFRAQFTEPSDFVFDIDGSDFARTSGGWIQGVSAANLPALTGEGVAMVKLVLEGCGINMPHLHPRASEMQYIISADHEGVLTSFVEENGGRTITNVLTTGQATFYPQGLTHLQVNQGCGKAEIISALGSDDFGLQTITSTALAGLSTGLPREGLAASLGISEQQLDELVAGLPSGIIEGAEACRARCGIY